MLRRDRHNLIKNTGAVIDRAVELSRTPGAPTVGTSSGATSVVSYGLEGNPTLPDAEGNTIHTAMTEIDFTEDPNARTVPSTPPPGAVVTRTMPEGFGVTGL